MSALGKWAWVLSLLLAATACSPDETQMAAVASAASSTASGGGSSTSAVGGMAGAGGTATGGAGGVGGTSAGDDICPGESHALSLGTALMLNGDTSGATDDYQGEIAGCADTTGPDVVFFFDVLAEGSLKIDLTAAHDPALYLRNSSCGATMQCRCSDLSGSESRAAHVLPGGVWVFVDAAASRSGPFTLSVSLQPASCGDGVLNPGEACDDGNTMNGDACDSLCQSYPPVSEDCSAPEPVALVPNSPMQLPVDTSWYADDATPLPIQGCTTGPTAGGRDRVYAVTAGSSGMLTATLSPIEPRCQLCDSRCFNPVLWAKGPSDCATGQQLACSDTPNMPAAAETISFPVLMGMIYYVVADGTDGPWGGNATLTLSLMP